MPTGVTKVVNKRRDTHELFTNGAIAHALNDSGCKIGQVEEHIAPEEGYDSQNENLGEQSGVDRKSRI